MKPIIKKVYGNKDSGQKLICIPRNSDIEIGDYVQIYKLIFEELEDSS